MAQEKFSTISALKLSFFFLALLGALFLALGLLPGISVLGSILLALIDLTGSLVIIFLRLFGVTALYDTTAMAVTVSGFKMLIDAECTAIYFLVIYSVAVIVSPSHPIGYKIKGILAGGVIIVFLNVLRIAALGVTGANVPQLFDFMHTYLWQGIFVIAVFFIWLTWSQGTSANKTLLSFCSVAIFVSTLAILGLLLVMESYLNLLANMTEGAFNAFLSNSLSVTASDVSVTYHYLGYSVAFPISVDVFDSSIFFALTIASAKANEFKRLVVRLAYGFGVLSLVHLIFALVIGYLVVREVNIEIELAANTLFESELSSNTLLLIRIYSITIPVLLWALMTTKIWPWLRKDH